MYRTDTDTGLATPEQVALVIADKRIHWDQNADDSDDVMLAAVRNAYALPGAQPVEDDGSALAAALIAFLTPDPTRVAPVVDADTGRATPEQIALIVAFERNYYEENKSASVEQLLAGVRNTLTLPGVWVPGGFPVQEDGTDHADALIAFLTPAPAADRMLAAIESLHQQVWAAAPVLTVETITDDGETYQALRYPVCARLVSDGGELRAVDVSTRWSRAEPDAENRQMDVSAGDHDYGSTLYYLHRTGEAHAVVPPEGWSETWL
ncbi:hypothetical protein [Rathayibacter sp. VKM Ac-2760]|uniref:hypothetical protein n=1 Tax=Rathayibacter sp. VKM Ac-2760 TaxID=2609253 RepID=UPI00131788B6|nr:hypothetical protein [Rathayibacter sp. VKM Ac-2760]QHC60982.1 hypothetical protein GSU72_19850 [Rathayibacter sp. VKM Ac-2760]